jgi:2-C-methyl-D-erythritol 4-phosphate cytidylyltransferase
MNVAIIAAAGQGLRMGGKRAKQFLTLAGIPIIFHTLQPFEQCAEIHEIIVVLPPEESADFLQTAAKQGLRKLSRVVAGGTSRSESVYRGLQAVRGATVEIVAVHDGVRPFVTADEISRTVIAAREHNAAVLVAPVTDTIKVVEDNTVVETLDREQLRRALTPQCFKYELLRRAFEGVDVLNPELTDESVLVEKLGVAVSVVEGSSRNIKITQSEDLAVGEAILRARTAR